MTELELAIKAAKDRIDYVSETARRKFTTRGEILSSVYQLKTEEAVEFIADGYPNGVLDNYPLIKAEVTATGKTPALIADNIVATRSAWVSAMSSIEQIRLAVNASLRSAASVEEVRSVCTDGEAELITFATGAPPGPNSIPAYPF